MTNISTAYIKENLQDINLRIQEACDRSGRMPKEITLVGVTKTIDHALVNASIDYGIRAVGESKPQEVKRKHPLINESVAWHMIGHLQTNKVKMVIDKVDLIHTLDSDRLADEINKRAGGINKVMSTLVQVNIGDEDQKSGVALEDLDALMAHVGSLENIRVVGLMAIAPYLEDPEAVRPYFKKMKALFDSYGQGLYKNVDMSILSMGMTHDFEVAIEEGATMIRVGTGIYGPRDY